MPPHSRRTQLPAVRLRKYLVRTLATLATVLVAVAAASPSFAEHDYTGEDAGSAPTSVAGDVAALVPATVELATPALCGGVLVYDQEDLATLCSAAVLLSAPTVPTACNQVVTGVVRLETDLTCTDTSGLRVGADNTVIDLNGHRITCVGTGYSGSCQGPSAPPEPDVGIDTQGFDNVHVFSHLPGGTLYGFGTGVWVRTESDNVKVKQLTITGPPPSSLRRPVVEGVVVGSTDCGGGNIRIGGGTSTGNDISNHQRGIQLNFSACVYVGSNTIHNNSDNGNRMFRSYGIFVRQSSDNHLRSNVVTQNGDAEGGEQGDAGTFLGGSTGNLVVENEVNRNRGHGIRLGNGATENDVVNNQMLFNGPGATFQDASSDQTGVNRWNFNNRCITQTTPQPPPGVCGTNEAPPPP